MIAKVVKSRDGRGSGGTGFGGLISYVSDKADAVATRNLFSLDTALSEMRAVANTNDRVARPAYHFILSWAREENPSDAEAFAAADHAVAALGATSHQAVYAVHSDRAHVHVHVAVNRIDPTSGRAFTTSQDFARLERACREIEAQQGWSQDRGRFQCLIETVPNSELDGEPVRKTVRKTVHLYAPAPDRLKSKAGARERGERGATRAEQLDERRTGRPPLKERLSDEVRVQVVTALERPDWAAVQSDLATAGFRYDRHGSGARIVSMDDPSEYLSPSHLGKKYGLKEMQKRLGALSAEPPANPPQRSKPIEKNDAEISPREQLWRDFGDHKKQTYEREKSRRDGEWRDQKSDEIQRADDLKKRQRDRLILIHAIFARQSLIGATLALWARLKRDQEWREHREKTARDRAEIKEKHRAERAREAAKKPDFRDYLETRNDDAARAALQRIAERDAGQADDQERPQIQLRRYERAKPARGSEHELRSFRALKFEGVADALGFKFIDGTQTGSRRWRAPDGAVIVQQRAGQASWFDTSNPDANGGIVELAKREAGGNLGEARKLLRPLVYGLETDPQPDRAVVAREQAEDHTEVRRQWRRGQTADGNAYLRGRGISDQTLSRFSDFVRTDRRGNALFAHQDERGVVGFERSGPDLPRALKFVKGGQKAGAVLGDAETAKRIVVVESGVDALSLAQSERRSDTAYLSTGGAFGRRLEQRLREFAASGKSIVAGFDADAEGDALADRLTGAERLRPDNGKDWNDELWTQIADQQRQRARDDRGL